jgi:adenosine kinase
VIEELRTAQGFVTTDLDDNQIWAFYVGAMGRAHEAELPPPGTELELAIVSSDSRQAMLERARELKRRGVPTFVDPSHALPILGQAELVELIEGAAGYVVNDYEWSLTLSRSALSEEDLLRRVGAVIVTRGEKGSCLRRGRDALDIPPVAAARVVDPTGCGDAYRGAFLHGLARGLSLETCAKMGSLMGALKVAEPGTQGLTIGPAAFRARFEAAFGSALP